MDNDIALEYGSDRKENMGLAEVTMKHRELGTKKATIERNLLVEEWEYAFEQDEWLTVRYPKMKDLKSCRERGCIKLGMSTVARSSAI